MTKKILGIDIGGTKTAVCVGTADGKILTARRTPTPSESFDAYCARLEHLCKDVLEEDGTNVDDIAVIGISAPGPLDVARGTLIAPPNTPGWTDVPIVKKVSDMFTGLPVVMNNDANAAAQAEFLFGDYKGTDNLIYLTFSTGMGAGIISNGELVQGMCDMGGEVGHITLDVDGEECGCGKRGCFEAYVGGRAVARRLRTTIIEQDIATAILDNAGGDPDNIDLKAFALAVKQGDEFATREWGKMIERLAQGISTLIMTLNPAVILLGTIALHNPNLVMTPLQNHLKKFTWEWPLESCTVAPSSLGVEIGTFGALAVGAGSLGKTS